MRWGRTALLAGLALSLAACGPLLDAGDDPTPTGANEVAIPAPTGSGADTSAVAVGAGAAEGVSATTRAATVAPVRAVTAVAEAAGPAPTGDTPSGAPLAADVLTLEEQNRAEYLAIESAGAVAALASAADRGERLAALTEAGAPDGDTLAAMAAQPTYRVLYRQRYPQKDGAGRAAEVLVYRYDTGEVVRSRVDLATNEVATEVFDASAPFPLPVTPEEIREAALVARATEGVRQALADAGLDPASAPANGILTGSDDPTSPCAGRRCLRLFFSSLRDPVPRFSVIVDMSALAVVDVVAVPGEGDER